MTVDPFAEAQVGSATLSTTAGTAVADRPASDPFTPARDKANPFAVSSDYRGEFIPSPGFEPLMDRVVVMIPRTFDPNAKDPFATEPGKTRELYTVDLYVLTGGRLSYFYKERGDPERGTQDEMKEWVVENVSPSQPFVIEGYWVAQGGIVGKLKKAHRDGAPFLGVPAMGPIKADRERGVTAAQVRASFDTWVRNGKPGNSPKYSWTLADPTPEQKQVAIDWWATAGAELKPINTADAPAR